MQDSLVSQLSAAPDAAAASAPVLGPARVVRAGRELVVRLEDGAEVAVELALGYAFTPHEGDLLLVLAQGERRYVVGVLHGTAKSQLCVPGDLDLRAGGRLRVFADQGLEVVGRDLTLKAKTVRAYAETLEETVRDAYRWVKGLLTVRAGQSRRIVEGEDHSRAQRTTILAEELVKIDADQVHLGH